MHLGVIIRPAATLVCGACVVGALAAAPAIPGTTPESTPSAQPAAAYLLAPPVVQGLRRSPTTYQLYLRTREPLNALTDDASHGTLAVTVRALGGVRADSDRDGTVSERSPKGGWCTRLNLQPPPGKRARPHRSPAAIGISIDDAAAPPAQVLGVLLPTAGRSKNPAVAEVKLGCKGILGAPR